MKTIVLTIAMMCAVYMPSFAQQLGLTFDEAEKQGISISYLDSIYPSAVHSDTSLAVFKTESEQQKMYEAYVKMLQDFGNFLSENNFKWDKPTRCFNRIYFNNNGSINYFLFNFLGKDDVKPTAEKQKEFKRLLNLFIKNYSIQITANTKFAQCSPTTYMPK